MVFVEFTVSEGMTQPGSTLYFVGASLQDVLEATDDGKGFLFTSFSSHRVLNCDDALILSLPGIHTGMRRVEEGSSHSFFFGSKLPPKAA